VTEGVEREGLVGWARQEGRCGLWWKLQQGVRQRWQASNQGNWLRGIFRVCMCLGIQVWMCTQSSQLLCCMVGHVSSAYLN
jgi:hypothetical protein